MLFAVLLLHPQFWRMHLTRTGLIYELKLRNTDGHGIVIARGYVFQPIGFAYLFMEEKPTNYVEAEMDLLNSGKKTEAVFVKIGDTNTQQPVYWDSDGLPNIASACINVVEAVRGGALELVSFEDESSRKCFEAIDTVWNEAIRNGIKNPLA